MEIPQEITIIPPREDIPTKLKVGWVIRETIGVCVINDAGLSRIDFDDNEQPKSFTFYDFEELE